MANDSRLHIIVSDVSVQPTTFRRGDQVPILYLPSNPEIAHINAFSTLWQDTLIVGIWGVVCSSIPAFILVIRVRRHASSGLMPPAES